MSTLAERRMHEQEAREVACRATIGAPWPARPTPAPGSELLSWTEALHVQYRVSGEATQRLAQLEARRTEALRTIAAAEADSLAADFGAIVAAQAAADLLERTLPAARTRVDRAAEDASLAEQARSLSQRRPPRARGADRRHRRVSADRDHGAPGRPRRPAGGACWVMANGEQMIDT